MTGLGIVLFLIGLIFILAIPGDLRWGNPRAARLSAIMGMLFIAAALWCFGIFSGTPPAAP